MYVEISPRQSGKTTRLIQAASDYLRHNPTHNIAVVGINLNVVNDLKNKFIERGVDSNHIKFLSVRGMSLTYSSHWRDIVDR
jgi:hypothetical protein